MYSSKNIIPDSLEIRPLFLPVHLLEEIQLLP